MNEQQAFFAAEVISQEKAIGPNGQRKSGEVQFLAIVPGLVTGQDKNAVEWVS